MTEIEKLDLKKKKKRCSSHGPAEANLTGIHEDTGSIPGLTQSVG